MEKKEKQRIFDLQVFQLQCLELEYFEPSAESEAHSEAMSEYLWRFCLGANST